MKNHLRDDVYLGKLLEKKNDRYISHLNEAFTDVRVAAFLLSEKHCKRPLAYLKGFSSPAPAPHC